MLGLASAGLWVTIRDWPHRAYTSIFFIVCLIAAVLLPAIAHWHDYIEWRLRADAAVVLAWMVVGACDFLMLRRVMRGAAGVEQKNDA